MALAKSMSIHLKNAKKVVTKMPRVLKHAPSPHHGLVGNVNQQSNPYLDPSIMHGQLR